MSNYDIDDEVQTLVEVIMKDEYPDKVVVYSLFSGYGLKIIEGVRNSFSKKGTKTELVKLIDQQLKTVIA
jgi:hypothetical protein